MSAAASDSPPPGAVYLRHTYVRCSARKTVIPCVVRLTSGITVMSSATRQPSARSCTMERCRVTGLGRPNRWRCSIAGWTKDPQREMHGARLTGRGTRHPTLPVVLNPDNAHSERQLVAFARRASLCPCHGPSRVRDQAPDRRRRCAISNRSLRMHQVRNPDLRGPVSHRGQASPSAERECSSTRARARTSCDEPNLMVSSS